MLGYFVHTTIPLLTVLIRSQQVQNVDHGITMLKAHNTVYHRMGSLQPGPGQPAKCAQVYIVDPSEQLHHRLNAMGGAANAVDQATLQTLQNMLLRDNSLVHDFKLAMEHPENEVAEYYLVVDASGNVDKRRYNAPRAAGEIALFQEGEGQADNEGAEAQPREIIVETRVSQCLLFPCRVFTYMRCSE